MNAGIAGILRRVVKGWATSVGYTVSRSVPNRVAVYDQDGLQSIHNHDFMDDKAFVEAYQRGVEATGQDYNCHWRVHVALWAAHVASRLPGDFVECGVNKGLMSSSIMHSLNWDTQDKNFWLLDTFAGTDLSLLTSEEFAHVRERDTELIASGYYASGVDEVVANFAEWANVRIIQGSVPGTLERITASSIAYLHIDMNASTPEIAALDFLWPRLTEGAVVLLDDYAYRGYEPQYRAVQSFAQRRGVVVLSLPTGQGLFLKPPG